MALFTKKIAFEFIGLAFILPVNWFSEGASALGLISLRQINHHIRRAIFEIEGVCLCPAFQVSY